MNKTILYPHLLDINTGHTPDFVFQHNGDICGYNLIMCFRTPAVIMTVNGTEIARPGDCIIHSLDFPKYHCSVPNSTEGFRNDWIHVLPETLTSLITGFQLSWDILLSTGQPDILTPYIKRLQNELMRNDEFSERAIINQLDDMLLAISRGYRKVLMLRDEFTVSERRYFHEFVSIRAKMLEDCQHSITIQSLAAKVNLSQERFAVLYRKFFGTTPYSDLISSRLVLARRLLRNSSMGVKEVAVACGWEDIHYFSRLFKKKIGMPPSQYR